MNLSVEIELDSRWQYPAPDLEELKKAIAVQVAHLINAEETTMEKPAVTPDMIRVEIPRAIQHLDIR